MLDLVTGEEKPNNDHTKSINELVELSVASIKDNRVHQIRTRLAADDPINSSEISQAIADVLISEIKKIGQEIISQSKLSKIELTGKAEILLELKRMQMPNPDLGSLKGISEATNFVKAIQNSIYERARYATLAKGESFDMGRFLMCTAKVIVGLGATACGAILSSLTHSPFPVLAGAAFCMTILVTNAEGKPDFLIPKKLFQKWFDRKVSQGVPQAVEIDQQLKSWAAHHPDADTSERNAILEGILLETDDLYGKTKKLLNALDQSQENFLRQRAKEASSLASVDQSVMQGLGSISTDKLREDFVFLSRYLSTIAEGNEPPARKDLGVEVSNIIQRLSELPSSDVQGVATSLNDKVKAIIEIF